MVATAAFEEVQVFFDGTIAKRTFFAGLGQCAAVFSDLVGREIIDISLSGFDQLHRPLIELVEIVGGVIQSLPLEAEPLHVLHDRVDVLGLFLFGVRVIETQVGVSTEFVGEPEVEADRLGVADVKVSVRLGWEARLYTSFVLVRLQVFNELIADKIRRHCDRFRGSVDTGFFRWVRHFPDLPEG